MENPNPQDPQVRTDIAKENIKDIIDDVSSSLSSDIRLLRSELIDIIRILIDDLQVEVHILDTRP